MSGISSWLLSIACVVMLSVLAEFVLPEGQINKYIRVIFSFIIMLVVIMPLPKLFGKDLNLDSMLGGGQVQENYLVQLNIDKLAAITDALNAQLEEEGIKNVRISINADILKDELEVEDIFVDLCDIEYTEKFGSKDILKAKTKIKDVINRQAILKGVEVRFNE